MRVKPTDPNAIIRYPEDPRTKLPAEGADVPESVYWTRLVLDGSVTRIEDPTTPTGHEPIARLTTRS